MVLATESNPDLLRRLLSRGRNHSELHSVRTLRRLSSPDGGHRRSSFHATRQNPADVRPFVLGAFRNLKDWVEHNVAPPPTVPMKGFVDAAGNFMPDRDADGNALGGLRLPHMPTTLDPSGLPAGAPLGAYRRH